jgi:hypothetical protein
MAYFARISAHRHDVDPFWMVEPDPTDVDRRKGVKLLTSVEKTDGKAFEAVFNFNGQKEAIVSVTAWIVK